MIKDITLRRLKEVPIKGNFTINCETPEYFNFVRGFFQTSANKITFQALIGRRYTNADVSTQYFPREMKSADNRFIISYNSLHELLKLREIFQIRASKFDMYLIKKRGYNPFDEEFFYKIRDPVIYKVRK